MNYDKRLNDFRGYTGIDVSNEISLFEYGLLWKLVNKNLQEYKFVYGINQAEFDGEICYTEFDYGYINRKDFITLCNENWFKIDSVLSYTGIDSKEEFISNFPYSVFDAIQYHGCENIFGSSYYSITISGCYCQPKKGAL